MGRATKKARSKRWVRIIFNPSMDEKEHADVRRLYVKAECLCVELPECDSEGRPKIVSYPLRNIFSFSRPHMPHDGMQPREAE